ncbi:MAG: Gfo/Idh/MocA family oxidoreductase, partial [Candidatus Nealsonbacteria bacterium]|nr:Gfo/Idh/MocA family oxidoreductase [Candidatus Nealsonbacteria bacterium]
RELNEIGDIFGVERRYAKYDDVLADPAVDFVHINTPIPDHGPMSIAALKAGKHVMCTVPMATSVDDCRQIVELVRQTGLKYMMAETVVYSREFLFVRELYEKGELGKIQFLQASHQQDMDGWPEYWPGLPPMHYATHCVSPCLALTRGEAEYVSCFGSGTIREELIAKYGSPFAVETTHFKFRNSDLSARVHRSLFDVARQYRESFDVFGSKQAFEWPLVEGDGPVLHTAKLPQAETARRVKVPDYAHLLPEEIRHFTTKTFLDLEEYQHLASSEGADPDGSHSHLVTDPGSLEGHGGSHPHLAHEFISALLEDRDPFPNAVQSANYTCVGILAHESAMKGGERISLPEFTLT